MWRRVLSTITCTSDEENSWAYDHGFTEFPDNVTSIEK
jgi:hypothetical protein